MTGLLSAISTTTRGILGLSRATLNLDPADDATRNTRRNICANCPAATRTKHLGRVPLKVLTPASTCSVCKCHITTKVKLAGETCPRGKW